jgi:hypothetical protein
MNVKIPLKTGLEMVFLGPNFRRGQKSRGRFIENMLTRRVRRTSEQPPSRRGRSIGKFGPKNVFLAEKTGLVFGSNKKNRENFVTGEENAIISKQAGRDDVCSTIIQ